MTQEQALTILKTGTNVFLTGEPGSGKTHTVNSFVASLRARGIEPAVTASTGIAATHIGGMTIHSWAGIGIKRKLDRHDLARIAANKGITGRVRRATVLIIDEVSMLSPETLGMVDAVCRMVRGNLDPFGGIQVVLVGDFFQLPPIEERKPESEEQSGQGELIIQIEETGGRFAYDAPVWKQANPTVCYLTEQYRQDDAEYLGVLSAIRHNEFGDAHAAHIEKRKIEYRASPENVPKLFSHNVDVDRVNTEMLGKLPGDAKEFKMSWGGPAPIVAALKKGCLSPAVLELKPGASIMFTKNNPKAGFSNGTLGVVERFDDSSGRPIVKMRNGKTIEVGPLEWVVEEGPTVIARIVQIPLRLAWAITVHKSQGMSLDGAVMDLSDVFEFGQGYVALSRVRRLSGLYILGWNERAFQVHPEVLARDEAFRTASEEAEKMFAAIPQAGGV